MNKSENTQDISLSRREMLLGGLRYAALTAIGAGCVTVGFKRRRLLREGKCLNNGVCPQCDVLSECGLTQARSVREAISEDNDEG